MPKKVEEIKNAILRTGKYSEAQAWAMAYAQYKKMQKRKHKK